MAQQKALKVPVRELPTIALAALLGCCLTPVLLYCSYDFIDSGTATVLHFVYPALVVVGGILFLKQRPALGTLLSVLVCVGGIALFFDPNAAMTAEGSALALLSGLTFAGYVLMLSAFPNRKATGFEALMGYLYLKGDYERMTDLIKLGLARLEEQKGAK